MPDTAERSQQVPELLRSLQIATIEGAELMRRSEVPFAEGLSRLDSLIAAGQPVSVEELSQVRDALKASEESFYAGAAFQTRAESLVSALVGQLTEQA